MDFGDVGARNGGSAAREMAAVLRHGEARLDPTNSDEIGRASCRERVS